MPTQKVKITPYHAWLFPGASGMKWESQNQLIKEEIFWKILTWTKPKATNLRTWILHLCKASMHFSFLLSTTKPQNVNIMETTGFHSFIGLFRFTITFSRCPQIARASLSGQRLYKTKYALQMVLNWQVNKSQVSTHISLLDLFRQHFCHEIRWKPAVLYLHVKQMQ